MFSKLSLLLATVMVCTSCGLHIGEDPVPQEPPSFKGNGYSCVGQIPDTLGNYFNDRMSEGEITEFMQCLQKSFLSFAQLTRGRDQSTYSPEEIREFLQRYFLKDRPISDDFLKEIMVIKQAIVGGANNRISRQELYSLIEILEDIRREAIRLKPHVPMLNPKLLTGLQDASDLGERLSQANEALRQTIRVFSLRFQGSRESYSFASLERLLTEFRNFVKWEQHFENSKPAAAWVAVVRDFKLLSVSPRDPSAIQPSEWVPLFQSMSRWYLAFLQYEAGVKNRHPLEGVGLQNMVYLADQLFDHIKEALSRQPNQSLRIDQILPLVDSMQKVGWIPARIRPQSLKPSLQALFGRILGDPRTPPADRRANALGKAQLDTLSADFHRWADVQATLDDTYRANLRQSRESVPSLQRKVFLPPEIKEQIKALDGSDWMDFLKIQGLMKNRPLFPEDQARIFLVPPEQFATYNMGNKFFNLSMMNLMRSVVTWVFRGYGEDSGAKAGWDAGLTSDELQRFYLDFRDVGIDLGIVDKRNCKVGNRAFIEGNLFTFSADGLMFGNGSALGNKLNSIEAIELFGFLYSGGTMAYELYDELKKVCETGSNDINGKPMLGRSCVRNQMPAVIKSIYTNMPNLVAFLKTRSFEEQYRFSSELLDTAFSKSTSDKAFVEQAELSTVSVVLHYQEALMTRFDALRNGVRDGKLDEEELRVAALNFIGFIRQFAAKQMNKELSEREAINAFLYIIKYRKMPEATLSTLWDLNWGISWSQEDDLDRLGLAHVFKLIISKITETGQTKEGAGCQQ